MSRRMRTAVAKLLAALDEMKMQLLNHGNGRGANAIVSCMRIVRRWAEDHGLAPDVDVHAEHMERKTQPGELE